MEKNDDAATFAQAKTQVRAFCEAREWDAFHGAKDLAIGAVTEAAELLEIFRFQSEEQIAGLLRDATSREAIADELADVLFFLLRFAGRFDFDLAAALERKIEKTGRRYTVEASRGSNLKR